MRTIVQRVSSASVSIEGEVVGQIGGGMLLLLGITPEDTQADADWARYHVCVYSTMPTE